jgi:transglycosylase-like protein with SLT domain/D-alanyl-D-alanine carboxypeptidase-like protein/putative Flp pilus-assembly TadE/G-like protein
VSAATILAAGSSGRRGSLALAAAVAVEAAAATGARTLLVEVAEGARRRGPTLLSTPAARELEDSLRIAGWSGSARGHLCHLGLGTDGEPLETLGATMHEGGAELVVAYLPAALWVPALDSDEIGALGGLIVVELPRERPLAALAVDQLRARGLGVKVASATPSPFAARRALAGTRPGGRPSTAARRIAAALLGIGGDRDAGRSSERGQALPALLGAGAILIMVALLLAAIGGAVTGKGRVQRAADLAALSAARSMRDDMPRLAEPRTLPDGRLNPRRLSRAAYLGRAEAAATDAARRNDVDPARLRIDFPDRSGEPPVRVRARVSAEIDPGELPGGDRIDPTNSRPIEVAASAVAEAAPPEGSWSGMPAVASGGGYAGPLVYRNGEGMRPDVAVAYDRMAAAARRAGHSLLVNSGFRSDAEQAELFARHPDPHWVAPPGHSLHRCATELDLGPPSAYGWLAANAPRFGFVRRYSWEAWHFGYDVGPSPCSGAGNAVGTAVSGAREGAPGLPSFVPGQFRDPIMRSAGRWNVSAGLLAAQLMAESGFNPRAVSPAGAQGIAQFMPSTAAGYGLGDPFDPVAAIDAQAHLMSGLLRQFHSVPLALAAYNAGSGAVGACSCIPYAETRAYVARILALADGAGVLLSPPLEVRLVS